MNEMKDPEDTPDIASEVMRTLEDQQRELLEIQAAYETAVKETSSELNMLHIHAWHVWALLLETRLPPQSIYPAMA
jgi:hypothetical protein